MAESTGSDRLRLVVVTHERKVLEEDCDSVSLPAQLGYVTILPQHTPLVSTLAVGEMSYNQAGADRWLSVRGGFFEISDNVVTVLADHARRPEEIDVEEAERDLEEARNAMATAAGEEVTRTRHALQDAEARLRVAQRH